MSNYKKGDFVRVGGLKYNYINKLELKSGLTKEYYKCELCQARLHVYADLDRFEVRSTHKLRECAEAHQEFVDNFKARFNRSMLMETILVDPDDDEGTANTTGSEDSFMLSFLDIPSESEVSMEESESEVSMNDSSVYHAILNNGFLDDTLVTSDFEVSVVTISDEDTTIESNMSSIMESSQEISH